MDQPLINRIVEGALLASSQPLTLAQLQELFPEDQPAPPGSVERALELLREGCQGRGVELVEVASGFRYQVRQDVHAFVARLWSERPSRYSRALLETLSLIAYRQPITRAEIEQIRGVAVSTNIVRTLEEREWVRVVGYRDLPGKPALLGTTRQFLDYFNLKSLDQLPPLSEIREIEDLDPQLAFAPLGDAIPAQVSADTAAETDDATETQSAASPAQSESATDTSSATPDDHAEPGRSDAADHTAPQDPSPAREEPPAGAAHEDTPEILV